MTDPTELGATCITCGEPRHRRNGYLYDCDNRLDPPATFEQPGWKPPPRRPVSHRITAVSTRPGAWRPPNPHTEDGDNAYLYMGDHRLPGPDGNLLKGIVWAVIWLIIAAAVVYGLIEVGLWAYGSWTS